MKILEAKLISKTDFLQPFFFFLRKFAEIPASRLLLTSSLRDQSCGVDLLHQATFIASKSLEKSRTDEWEHVPGYYL